MSAQGNAAVASELERILRFMRKLEKQGLTHEEQLRRVEAELKRTVKSADRGWL
jgi:hypothetical protein